MRDDPVVLFCSPRGGSSLVAGVFARHGFWTGKTFGGKDGIGSGGYVNHENAAIKAWMKTHFPLRAGIHYEPNAAKHDLRKACERIVPTYTPWMFKGPSEYFHVFDHWFPNMVPVMVFRSRDQAVEAHVRRRGETVRANATKIVESRYDFMEQLLDKRHDTHRVDAELIVDGKTAQIEDVIVDRYGMAFDHRLAMEGISPLNFHRSTV